MKKRTKRFLGTLAIIGVFTIGTVFGADTLLKFTGINTINEAKKLIQELIQDRNTIVDKYTELDKVATSEIKSLEDDINSLKVQIESLTQEKSELQTKYDELSGCEPYSTIVSLQQEITNKENEIKSLKTEISNKEAELKRKDALLQEKDGQLRDKDSKITVLENELKIANSKCKELQTVIDNTDSDLKDFSESKLTEKGN